MRTPPFQAPVIAPTSAAGSALHVGVGALAVAQAGAPGSTQTLITYALGSCIGVTLYDPMSRVGGLLHFMLPESAANPTRAATCPAMFADSGIELLFQRAERLGCNAQRIIVCAAGGAEILAGDSHFRIGARNRTMLRRVLWQRNLLLRAQDIGGSHSRTLALSLVDGAVTVRSQGRETVLWKAPA
ncbi:MAG: chemotaxis protein CheD [Phycisphaerae bacterium]|nr:chemotaxis protein CheD [Phycisphaerae bacterium]